MPTNSAPPDQPGASASAVGRRAQRTYRRRSRATAALAASATLFGLVGLTTSNRWWLAGTGVAAGLAWWWRAQPDPQRWRRGAEGEVETARLLASLPKRFVVLHDRRPPGGRGNLDHLVIGPNGVWVVDSKVRRARLRICRGQVWAGQYPIDVGAVIRQAAGVERALGVSVTAIVAVHGTGLRRRGKSIDGVRVIPADRLVSRLRRRRRGPRGPRLPAAAVATLAARAQVQFPPC